MLSAPFRFEAMTEANARSALSWRYDPPYDFYNRDPARLDELVFNRFLNPSYPFPAREEGEKGAKRTGWESPPRVRGGD